jgi:general secretion pathway protein I
MRPRSSIGRRPYARASRGFTLLEVMVAIAILGLGLTAILSAQADSFKSSTHARNISVATGLMRCKMVEVEEHLLRDGYQELAENESGVCCEGDESAMKCAWKVEKPELPEPKLGELDLDTDIGSGKLGALGALAQGEQGKDIFSGADGGIGDVAQVLAGAGAGSEGAPGGAEGAAGIASMVMGMVYPDLKALFEASTRKITVTLSWTEGASEYEIAMAQWVTSPQEGGVVGEVAGEQEAAEAAAEGLDAPTGPGKKKTPGGTGKEMR